MTARDDKRGEVLGGLIEIQKLRIDPMYGIAVREAFEESIAAAIEYLGTTPSHELQITQAAGESADAVLHEKDASGMESSREGGKPSAPSTTAPNTALAKALLELAENPDEVCGQFARGAMRKAASVLSATPRSVYEAAKKALRRYVWKAQNPAAPIAGTASLDGAMVELRDALLAAGEEQGFENNSSDGGKATNG